MKASTQPHVDLKKLKKFFRKTKSAVKLHTGNGAEIENGACIFKLYGENAENDVYLAGIDAKVYNDELLKKITTHTSLSDYTKAIDTKVELITPYGKTRVFQSFGKYVAFDSDLINAINTDYLYTGKTCKTVSLIYDSSEQKILGLVCPVSLGAESYQWLK